MRYLPLVLAGLVVGPGAALAANAEVNFQGTLTGVCTLAVPTPGILVLAADGKLTSSPGGTPAVVTILSVGSNTVSVAPPVWTETPEDYDAGGELFEVGYTGVGGLSLVNVPFTASPQPFVVPTLPVTALTVNARASNPDGFGAGTYKMKVLVTCSP